MSFFEKLDLQAVYAHLEDERLRQVCIEGETHPLLATQHGRSALNTMCMETLRRRGTYKHGILHLPVRQEHMEWLQEMERAQGSPEQFLVALRGFCLVPPCSSSDDD